MEEDQFEEVLGLQEALSLEIGVLGGQYLETVIF